MTAVLFLVCLHSAVWGSLLGLFLRMACSLLGEQSPTFRRAVTIGTVSFWAQVALAGVVLGLKAVILWPFLAVPLAALIYSGMLPLRFARAVAVAITQVLVVVGGVAILGTLFNVAGWFQPASEFSRF